MHKDRYNFHDDYLWLLLNCVCISLSFPLCCLFSHTLYFNPYDISNRVSVCVAFFRARECVLVRVCNRMLYERIPFLYSISLLSISNTVVAATFYFHFTSRKNAVRWISVLFFPALLMITILITYVCVCVCIKAELVSVLCAMCMWCCCTLLCTWYCLYIL